MCARSQVDLRVEGEQWMSYGESYAARQAGLHLAALLRQSGRYRRTWGQFVDRDQRGEINQDAVAEVLASYMRSHPSKPSDRDITRRQLRIGCRALCRVPP
jgi:hypothetical protein